LSAKVTIKQEWNSRLNTAAVAYIQELVAMAGMQNFFLPIERGLERYLTLNKQR